jgi:C4-dicarboxylate-specific signal transduction histidine kinase
MKERERMFADVYDRGMYYGSESPYLRRVVAYGVKPFAIAGFFVLVAFLWTLVLQHLVPYPFLFLFLGAVMGSAWFGGRIAAVVSVMMATAMADYFFVPPLYSFWINPIAQTYTLAFILCAIVMSWMSVTLKRSENVVREARDELEVRVLERTAELRQSIDEMHESERKRRRAEQALNNAHMELAALNHRLGMGEMAASIAHELNQPLMALTANAYACREWLRATPVNVERASLTAEKCVEESRRASEVVKRVRALFRKEIDSRDVVDINRLIRDLAELLREDAERRGVKMYVYLDPEAPPVKADAVQVQQVLLNLAMNGMDAMMTQATGRDLVISTRRNAEDEVEIEVSDCGGGVSAEQSQRMFEPFFTTKPQGLGMGLPISRSIVEAHEGRLWFTERSPRGSSFHFTIPVLR